MPDVGRTWEASRLPTDSAEPRLTANWLRKQAATRRLAVKRPESRQPNRFLQKLSSFTGENHECGVQKRLPRSIGGFPRSMTDVVERAEVVRRHPTNIEKFGSGEGNPSSGPNLSATTPIEFSPVSHDKEENPTYDMTGGGPTAAFRWFRVRRLQHFLKSTDFLKRIPASTDAA